jgi:hypothetical protein
MKPNITWRDGIPICQEAECPHFDGKRCRLTGFQPNVVCEVIISHMFCLLKIKGITAKRIVKTSVME